jgi:hypothetical protein
LNIQSLAFNHGGMKFGLTCPGNLTLGKAIVMWSLLGIEFSDFDFISINGRKISKQSIMSYMLMSGPEIKI